MNYEHTIELKDGRKLHQKDNGFTKLLEDQKGNVIPVSDEYYNRVKKNRK